MRFNLQQLTSLVRGSYARLPEPDAHDVHDLEAGYVLPSPESFELDALSEHGLAADTLEIAGPLGKLPHEIFLQVCRNLDPQSLTQLCDVSQAVRKAASDPTLWQPMQRELTGYPVHLASHWRGSNDTVEQHAHKRKKKSLRLGATMTTAYILVNLILFAKLKPNLKMPPPPSAPRAPRGDVPAAFNLTESDCAAMSQWGYPCSPVPHPNHYGPYNPVLLGIPTPDPERWGIARMDTTNTSCIEEFKAQSGACRNVNVWDDPLNWCSVPRDNWPPKQPLQDNACYRALNLQGAWLDYQHAYADF